MRSLKAQPTIICHSDNFGPYRNTECGGGIRVSRPFSYIGKGADIVSTVDFDTINFDMIGTTVSLPSAGLLSISLKGQNNQILGSSTFPWARSGLVITPSDVLAIEDWISTFDSIVYEVNIDFVPFQVQTNVGTNVASLTVSYNSSPVAMAASIWTECSSEPQSQLMVCG